MKKKEITTILKITTKKTFKYVFENGLRNGIIKKNGASFTYYNYLEGRQVEKGKNVEEANAMQSHLDDPGAVGLLTLGSRLW